MIYHIERRSDRSDGAMRMAAPGVAPVPSPTCLEQGQSIMIKYAACRIDQQRAAELIEGYEEGKSWRYFVQFLNNCKMREKEMDTCGKWQRHGDSGGEECRGSG
ncbi:hypothetical protein ACHAWF_010585 [Thalassiosira exigua]